MNRLVLILVIISVSFSCSKEGSGGKASINGKVKHHSTIIPKAFVYINYGAKELPGTSPSDYDDSTKANSDAFYSFGNLKKGS